MSKKACHHCGLDCESSVYYFEEKPFCCHGCKSVFRLLKSHKLDEIDWEHNAIIDKVIPRIKLNPETVDFIFADQKTVNDSKGYINFYRLSNKVLDLKIPMNLKDSIIQISKEKLVKGSYDIKVFWTINNRKYMYKKSILL
jgi:hypothetical protein